MDKNKLLSIVLQLPVGTTQDKLNSKHTKTTALYMLCTLQQAQRHVHMLNVVVFVQKHRNGSTHVKLHRMWQ